MFEKLAQTGVLGLVSIGIIATFIFLTVASVLNAPGLREIPNDQLIGTVVTLTAALGGAAAAKFGNGKDSNGG
jgi:1,4-dihydroxy-2-naphthoate octaprenyltransferase